MKAAKNHGMDIAFKKMETNMGDISILKNDKGFIEKLSDVSSNALFFAARYYASLGEVVLSALRDECIAAMDSITFEKWQSDKKNFLVKDNNTIFRECL